MSRTPDERPETDAPADSHDSAEATPQANADPTVPAAGSAPSEPDVTAAAVGEVPTGLDATAVAAYAATSGADDSAAEAGLTSVGWGSQPRYHQPLEQAASPAPTRRRRGVTAGRVRGGLAVLTIGAVAAAGAALVWDLVPESADTETVAEDEIVADDVAAETVFTNTTAADCITWTDPESPELESVPCEQEHMFEVAAKIDLAPVAGMEFGPNALLPGVERLALLRDEQCAMVVDDYLDGRLDPRGRFTVGLIRPSEGAWARGERTVLCGLQQTSVDGGVNKPFEGRVADQDQSLVYAPGTCRGIVDGLPSDPVPCDEPHAVEITAIIDLAEEFPDAFPTLEDQDEFLEPACRAASEEYIGSPEGLYEKQLTVFWDNIGEPSWQVGSRLVNCTVGHGDADGRLATIVGDVRGEITLDGHAPDPDADAVPPPAPAPGAPAGAPPAPADQPAPDAPDAGEQPADEPEA